ncbi:MAG: ABC transporter permease [Elusimicrobia bacterium]|nr:ABC transporter permease [Elusimicrobiota bacterium]
MRRVLALAANAWRENLRSRFFLLTLAFAGIFLYLSFILGALAVEQQARVLLDFGLAFIELMGLAGAIYGATTMVLRELETKTIYLILSRPVGRGEYLLGRFLGLMLSVLVSMALMAAVHLIMLRLKGWSGADAYAMAWLGGFLKVLVTASLTLFLAVFSSSALTAGVIACALWSLGHFLPELRFLVSHGAPRAAVAPLTFLSWVVPDLQLLNFRDRLQTVPGSGPEAGAAVWLGYCALYCAVWLALAWGLLRRKEL